MMRLWPVLVRVLQEADVKTRLEAHWISWGKYLWGKMERNGTEEAERGLRPLHWSDPGEGEREGRKEGWVGRVLDYSSKCFGKASGESSSQSHQVRNEPTFISLPHGATGWEQLMGSLTLEPTLWWIQSTAPGSVLQVPCRQGWFYNFENICSKFV